MYQQQREQKNEKKIELINESQKKKKKWKEYISSQNQLTRIKSIINKSKNNPQIAGSSDQTQTSLS